MLQKTAQLLQMRQQPRRGVPKGEDEDMREMVEREVEREDYQAFYGNNPVSQQLGPQLGRMLKEKPADHEEKVREGAKGVRG